MSLKEKIIDKVKQIMFTFACVTTCIVLANAVYILIFYGIDIMVEASNYWMILLMAFLTSLCNLIYPYHEVSKKTAIVLVVIHFILICAIVLGLGSLMGWYDFANIIELFSMVLAIAIIFAVVYILVNMRDKKIADKMNEKLKMFNDESKE